MLLFGLLLEERNEHTQIDKIMRAWKANVDMQFIFDACTYLYMCSVRVCCTLHDNCQFVALHKALHITNTCYTLQCFHEHCTFKYNHKYIRNTSNKARQHNTINWDGSLSLFKEKWAAPGGIQTHVTVPLDQCSPTKLPKQLSDCGPN